MRLDVVIKVFQNHIKGNYTVRIHIQTKIFDSIKFYQFTYSKIGDTQIIFIVLPQT